MITRVRNREHASSKALNLRQVCKIDGLKADPGLTKAVSNVNIRAYKLHREKSKQYSEVEKQQFKVLNH